MPDLAHAIMEQAMKYGRKVTFRRADAMVEAPPGVAAPQFIEMVLTNSANQNDTTIFPTHAKNGRQLSDSDFVGLLKQSAEKLAEREPK